MSAATSQDFHCNGVRVESKAQIRVPNLVMRQARLGPKALASDAKMVRYAHVIRVISGPVDPGRSSGLGIDLRRLCDAEEKDKAPPLIGCR